MRRWTLVRHGQADAGGADPGLNVDGRRQVDRLRARLVREPFDTAWSSPQARALQTAEAILAVHSSTSLSVDDSLCEIDYLAQRAEGTGEETLLDALWVRTGTWLSDREVGESVLVVAHGGPLRLILCRFLGLPAARHWSFRLDNASITVLEQAPGLVTLIRLNDCCHLEGGQ